MATKGLQRLVRRAVMARLKANATLTALVPATSIFGQDAGADPAWPFVKTGPATTLRRKATGTDGGTITFDVHAFARARQSAGQIAETGEDHAGRIGGAIETALADCNVALSDGSNCKIVLSDLQLMQDDEPGAFHYIAQVNARVLAATGI